MTNEEKEKAQAEIFGLKETKIEGEWVDKNGKYYIYTSEGFKPKNYLKNKQYNLNKLY